MTAAEPKEAVPVLSPEQRLAKQKKDLGRGCQSCFGCAGVAFLYVVIGLGAAPVLRRLTVGGLDPANVDVVGSFRTIANEMFGVAALSFMAFLFGLQFVRGLRGAVVVAAATMAIAGAIGISWWYTPYVAVEFGSRSVRLLHLWPHPGTTLDPRRIRSLEVRESTTPSIGTAVVLKHLDIVDENGVLHRSLGSISVAELKTRLEAARTEGAR